MWATRDIDGTVPMYGQGEFELLTQQEFLAAVKSDGKPRFNVLESQALAELVQDGAVDTSRGAMLVLALDPSCFLYYMNACIMGDAHENITRKVVLGSKNPDEETAPGLLADAENGVQFSVIRSIKKGEQLLHYFPSRALIEEADRNESGNTPAQSPRNTRARVAVRNESSTTPLSPGRNTRASTRAAAAEGGSS